MATPAEELVALKRLMESVNRVSTSNAASIGKLGVEIQNLKQQLALTQHIAQRSMQMCNDLIKRVSALEMQRHQ